MRRAPGLQPHLIRTFPLSHDPGGAEQLRAGVGLDRDPPRHAAVRGCDEKSRSQALGRTPPGWPLPKGRCATLTQDGKRHGTAALCVAGNTAPGAVLGKTYRKRRPQEALRFLREVGKTGPPEQESHLVLDHCATSAFAWIASQRRIFPPCTPPSAAWANRVERFRALLMQQRMRRGVCTSVPPLEQGLEEYGQSSHANPRPRVGTQSVGGDSRKRPVGAGSVA